MRTPSEPPANRPTASSATTTHAPASPAPTPSSLRGPGRRGSRPRARRWYTVERGASRMRHTATNGKRVPRLSRPLRRRHSSNPFFDCSPPHLDLHRQLADLAFGLPQPAVLVVKAVLTLQAFAASGQELIPPGRQRCASTPNSRLHPSRASPQQPQDRIHHLPRRPPRLGRKSSPSPLSSFTVTSANAGLLYPVSNGCGCDGGHAQRGARSPRSVVFGSVRAEGATSEPGWSPRVDGPGICPQRSAIILPLDAGGPTCRSEPCVVVRS